MGRFESEQEGQTAGQPEGLPEGVEAASLEDVSIDRESLEELQEEPDPEEVVDPDLNPDFERFILPIGNQIEVVVEPGRTRNWSEFCRNAPPYSISLDGAVEGLQEALLVGGYAPKVNFNHHEGVLRGATTATCRQVFEAIKDNLFKTFEPPAGKKLRVYVNDCDHDVCLSIWLLANHETVLGAASNQLLEKLVDQEDRLDRFAGAYPVNLNDSLLGQMTWIFKPYDLKKDRIMNMSAEEMADVIETVGNRITLTLAGEGRSEVPRTKYKQAADVFPQFTEPTQGWSYVTHEEPLARTRLRTEGKPFISVREIEGDVMRVSIGKFGPYFPVSLPGRYKIFNALDELKGTEITPPGADDEESVNRWSGSDTVGGSPRVTGTRASLNELARVNNALFEIENSGNGGLSDKRIDAFIRDELPQLLDSAQESPSDTAK